MTIREDTNVFDAVLKKLIIWRNLFHYENRETVRNNAESRNAVPRLKASFITPYSTKFIHIIKTQHLISQITEYIL